MDPFFIYIRTQPAVATHTHIQSASRTAAKVGGVEQIRASSLSSLVRRCDRRERTTEFLHTEKRETKKMSFQ
jgi:hypothetical protein